MGNEGPIIVEPVVEPKVKRKRGRPRKTESKKNDTQTKEVLEKSVSKSVSKGKRKTAGSKKQKDLDKDIKISDEPMTGQEKEELDEIEEELKNTDIKKVTNSEKEIEDFCSKILKYCEVQAGVELYPYQREFGLEIIRCLVLNLGEELTGLFSRQCIPAGQRVYMADGGFKGIEELEIGDKVLSINENNQIEVDTVVDKWRTGVRKRLKIKTLRGYEIECSPKHLFYTPQGWREAGQLVTRKDFKKSRKGQKGGRRETLDGETYVIRHPHIVGSINKGIFGEGSLGVDLAKFLGYMVSDGYYNKNQNPKFTNTNKKYIDEVREIVEKNFNSEVKEYRKGNGLDLVFDRKVSEFIEEVGIRGQIAERKRIPKQILTGSREEVASFLNRLWSGDGWITVKKNNHCEVGIGVQSYELAKEIVFLLNKFGVGARIEKQNSYGKQQKDFWKIRIGRSVDIKRFFEGIGLIYGKEEQSKRALEYVNSLKRQSGYFLDEDVSWDCIVDIEELEEIEMYDITTKNNHNFICEGFIVHNSGKTEAVTVVLGGCMVLLPTLARQMPGLYEIDMYKDGLWVD